ncbi:pyrroline-5-carboxylate reductase [Gammaproteobacteria bacterium]|nr:pyrroline-5-carboxylate reductase [Gammaproteobacteria bacterium]
MNRKKISIIGAGNMGACIISGLIKSGYPEKNLWVSNPSKIKLNKLHEKYNELINVTTSNTEAVNNSDIILLTVKPITIPSVLKEISILLKDRKKLIISVAAGVSEKSIEHFIKFPTPIIKAMPNIPSIIGCGATGLYANSNVSDDDKNLCETIFRTFGVIVWVDQENLIDAITAVSGCGPAYFFLVMEAIQNAGEKLGLPKETAKLLTMQTALGAAKMAIESSENVNELRQVVTSKGGATEMAINTLESLNIRDIFNTALTSANLRAKELEEIIKKEMES